MVYLATRMVPPIMLVVPMFLIVRNLGLIDTPLALIAVYCVLTLPFSIWLLQSYFRTMPVELEEAAVIDGASRWQTVRMVLLPLSLPVVAASFVDTASIQFDYVMAAGVITALPPFLLALIFQRFIVSGLSSGAVKG